MTARALSMTVRNLVLLCALCFLCSSCTNIKNRKLTDENKDKIMSEVASSKDFTDNDRQLLFGYMMRRTPVNIFQGGKPTIIPTGKTVGEMIEEQRQWVAQEAEKEKAEKEKEQKLAAEISAKEGALRDLLTVTLYALKDSNSGFMSGFEVSIAFKAGSKDIRAFEGNLSLVDVLGNSLGEIPVEVLRPLKANDSGTTNYHSLYMAFPQLRQKHIEDIKTQWKPTKIILADSTELLVPQRTE